MASVSIWRRSCRATRRGHSLPNPPILWDIESDPLLAGTKLIAEAWDAAGLYQVGSFIGDTWQEWNGRFRDDVRRFVKGDDDTVSRFATRLLGSPDLYGHEEREAEQSINFVTCHDGFTLNDLVSYDRKHNEANGEDNRDGSNDNLSWNCGARDPPTIRAIESLRNRQVKNLSRCSCWRRARPCCSWATRRGRRSAATTTRTARTTRSAGSTGACSTRHADVHRFVRELNAFRQRRDVVGEPSLSLNQLLEQAHRVARRHARQPDWSDAVAFAGDDVRSLRARFLLHLVFNAYWEPLAFELPPDAHTTRRQPGDAVSTRPSPSPDDIHQWAQAPIVRDQSSYVVQPRSVVVLGSGRSGAGDGEPAVPGQ